jgi:hypothetical protein
MKLGIELYRRYSKVQRFMKIKGHRIHAYLDYNIIGNQKQFMCIALVIKEISGMSTSVIDPTHCINKAILCSGSNVNHSTEKS